MQDDRETMQGSKQNGKQKPVVVRNRDIPLLADVVYIMQDICAIERHREWQKERMYNITQHLSGMPGQKGMANGLDAAFALLSEIEEEHEEKCKEYVRQLKQAQDILNGIESRSMRSFVTMKYIMDVPDVEIREELNMTKWSFNKAKQSIEQADCMASVVWHERFILRKQEKICKNS